VTYPIRGAKCFTPQTVGHAQLAGIAGLACSCLFIQHIHLLCSERYANGPNPLLLGNRLNSDFYHRFFIKCGLQWYP
jgi:hypothetical protein